MIVSFLYLLLELVLAALYGLGALLGDDDVSTEAYLRWETLKVDFSIWRKEVGAWVKAFFVFSN